MDTHSENKSAAVEAAGSASFVPFPKQAEDTAAPRWDWVERSVWTKRMLDRLDTSEARTVWFSLWDKVCAEDNLHQAALEVILNRGSAGVDGQTTEQFKTQWSEQVAWLRKELLEGRYQPQPGRRVWIEKLGSPDKRPLGIPAVRDRVVQAAMRHVLEPIFERDFAEQSYGFRPGRGCLDALRRVEELMVDGYTWVVDADLKSYFDTIPHDRLLALVKQRVADGRVLALLESFLKAGVLETGKDWEPTECGTPQGGVISPLLANLYLNPLDHQVEATGWEMVRYADDLVILCRTQSEAHAALAQLSAWVSQSGLTLHPTKTRIVNAAEAGGFDFLGYHFERYREGSGKKWFRKKSEQKLRASLRAKTSRLREGSLDEIIAQVNPTLKGWHGYFRYSARGALAGVDRWVRRRLRSIQRWRWGRKGSSRGRENVEMPNAWFAAAGLFSLENAPTRKVQS
jgi:RNA-directed DNA polymerase